MSRTTPTRTYCKHSGPCPTLLKIGRGWSGGAKVLGKLPVPGRPTSWLVGCFGFNAPLRQYFSLYRAVSQREGERGERIDESKNNPHPHLLQAQ